MQDACGDRLVRPVVAPMACARCPGYPPQSRRPSFGEPWPDGRAGHAFGSGNPTAAGTCGALVRRQHARGLADLRPGPVPRPTTADLTALYAAAQSPGGVRRGQAARCLAVSIHDVCVFSSKVNRERRCFSAAIRSNSAALGGQTAQERWRVAPGPGTGWASCAGAAAGMHGRVYFRPSTSGRRQNSAMAATCGSRVCFGSWPSLVTR